MLLMLSGLPAFVCSKMIVTGLGPLGVNQIWSFMISLPPVLSAWYFFLGWLVDRWRFKRLHPS
jgi:hypothetical protein